MPYLGDYLGQLLSEISMARMQSDLETIRLAELYAAHPLLRTMPVPHVRLPDVELEIPVLVKASEDPRVGEPTRGGAKLADMAKKFEQVLAAHLSKVSRALSPTESKKLRGVLSDRIALHGMPTDTSADVNRIADDLTAAALGTIAEFKRGPGLEQPVVSPQSATELKETVRREFLKLRTLPPRLAVLVTSKEIREAGTTENLMRLRLKVSEQGVEWTTIESEGVQQDRLVPE